MAEESVQDILPYTASGHIMEIILNISTGERTGNYTLYYIRTYGNIDILISTGAKHAYKI